MSIKEKAQAKIAENVDTNATMMMVGLIETKQRIEDHLKQVDEDIEALEKLSKDATPAALSKFHSEMQKRRYN